MQNRMQTTGKTSDLRTRFHTAEACGHLETVIPKSNRLDQCREYTKNTKFANTKFAHHAARKNLKSKLLKVRK